MDVVVDTGVGGHVAGVPPSPHKEALNTESTNQRSDGGYEMTTHFPERTKPSHSGTEMNYQVQMQTQRSPREICFNLMGKPAGGRDWIQIYAIYGTDEWQTVAFLSFHAAAFSAAAVLTLLYFAPLLVTLHLFLPSCNLSFLRFAAGFAGFVAAISALCLLCAAGSVLHSSLALRWEMAQRMLAAVPDWSAVRTALDVGCGRGILLNAVAGRMKKEGTGGRVVGLERRREAAVEVLRRAGAEGVGEQVTFREGEARALPFGDGYFDVVVSAVHFSGLTVEERGRALGEAVRVLKPGGVGVFWDLMCGPELTHRLREMRMEDVRLSERVTAYLVASHIVSFQKPLVDTAAPPDWRAVICC